MEPWFGTFHVRPTSAAAQLPEDIAGGYVHMLAMAADDTSFRSLVRERLAQEHLGVVEVEEAMKVAGMDTELDAAGHSALARLKEGSAVEAGTFFGYTKDDA